MISDNDVHDHLIVVVVIICENDEDDDEDDDAHKIVHLSEVLRSRELKSAGKLHNLANVDPGILVKNLLSDGYDSLYT